MASITYRNNGNSALISTCYTDIYRKTHRKSTTVRKEPGMTDKQFRKMVEQKATILEMQKSTCYTDKITLSDFIDKWFSEYADEQLEETSEEWYRTMSERVKTSIGHTKLCDVTPNVIRQLLSDLSSSGVRKDDKAKPKIDFVKLRKEKKLKKVDISKKCGVSIATLDNVEKGLNIALETADKLCKGLELIFEDTFDIVSRNGGKLSAKTLNSYRTFLSSVFSRAVKWEFIERNPIDLTDAFKSNKDEEYVMETSEIVEMLQCLEKESIYYRTLIQLILRTGMRRSEALGLKWADIDLGSGVIRIARSIAYTPAKGTFVKKPKTKKSVRCIKLDNTLIQLICNYKEDQEKTKNKCGDQWIDTGFVFQRMSGKPILPDTLTTWFAKFCKRAGLSPEIHIHTLRHTNASLLIAEHVPLTTVSSRLGHASTATTTKIYAHAIDAAEAKAINVIDGILKNKI